MAFVNYSLPQSDPVDPTTGERFTSRVKRLFSVPLCVPEGEADSTLIRYYSPASLSTQEESEQPTIRVKADGPAFLDL